MLFYMNIGNARYVNNYMYINYTYTDLSVGPLSKCSKAVSVRSRSPAWELKMQDGNATDGKFWKLGAKCGPHN